MDHVIRYHDDPSVKMIVVLGEVSEEGGAISAAVLYISMQA